MKLNQVFQTYMYIYIYIQMSVGPFRAVTLHGYMVYYFCSKLVLELRKLTSAFSCLSLEGTIFFESGGGFG